MPSLLCLNFVFFRAYERAREMCCIMNSVLLPGADSRWRMVHNKLQRPSVSQLRRDDNTGESSDFPRNQRMQNERIGSIDLFGGNDSTLHRLRVTQSSADIISYQKDRNDIDPLCSVMIPLWFGIKSPRLVERRQMADDKPNKFDVLRAIWIDTAAVGYRWSKCVY